MSSASDPVRFIVKFRSDSIIQVLPLESVADLTKHNLFIYRFYSNKQSPQNKQHSKGNHILSNEQEYK